MQTRLLPAVQDTPEGREAEAILRACVHCGFCLATCPTYQLLGDERDSPRGRIYLIKQMLEGEAATASTQRHLDRCLTCLACETTCPSGVRYGRLIDIGRGMAEARIPRPWCARFKRAALRTLLLQRPAFALLLAVGRAARAVLPPLRTRVPALRRPGARPTTPRTRRMLLLEGCVQPSLAPSINAATARVLDRLGIATSPAYGCCGAINRHLGCHDESLDDIRRNIDTWWPAIESGVEAIVSTASGCGVLVKDYGHVLRDDPQYADKAARVSALARDVSEVLADERETLVDLLTRAPHASVPLAFHAPCTLQHGQRLRGVVEAMLQAGGFALTPVPDAHLCCGSAGTYSLLQRELSMSLRSNKITALESGRPARIATANIGCLTHLQSGTRLPVTHWVELIDERLAAQVD